MWKNLWQFAGYIALEHAINRTNTGICMGDEFQVQLNLKNRHNFSGSRRKALECDVWRN